jgi:GxxExxY protein
MHVSDRVKRAATSVFSELGSGLSESVYQHAIAVALRGVGYNVEVEKILPVTFREHQVGFIRADLVVNGDFVVEVKTVNKLTEAHVAQLKAYLLRVPEHAEGPSGVLVNFALSAVEFREVALNSM